MGPLGSLTGVPTPGLKQPEREDKHPSPYSDKTYEGRLQISWTHYSESELCGGAVTVSFPKYLPWQAMHFLQCSTHFSKMELRSF
jgi:hypothetical protein